jgi:hypothetical protein
MKDVPTYNNPWGQSVDDKAPTTASTPEMENAGANHPYRGQEMHGVVDTGSEERGDPNGEGRQVPYMDDANPHSHEQPVPVRIVNTDPEQVRMFRTYQVSLRSGEATRIVAKNPARTIVRLTNSNSSTVYISNSQTPNQTTGYDGYPLRPNDPGLPISTTQAVYATYTDPANPNVLIAVLEEYTVHGDDK